MESASSSNGSPKEGSTLPVKATRSYQRKSAKHSFWQQPQLILNLASVIFLCVGCLMLLSSHQQHGTQVIMKYPVEHGNLALSMVIRDGMKPVPQDSTAQQQNALLKQNTYGNHVKVEFASYGNYVPLVEALTIAEPEPIPYVEMDPEQEADASGDQNSSVNIFVGILSTCCTELSHERRLQIRETWKSYALERHKNVDIKFILSQPKNESLTSAVDLLTKEVQEHDDIVIVKGFDKYKNLPKKLIGLMRYVRSIPRHYTHLLKTDDDCYVRMHKIINSLKSQNGGYIMNNLYMGCIENRSGFQPVRDSNSKWYIPFDIMSKEVAEKMVGTKYLAGWGYILSQDVVNHALAKVDHWHTHQHEAPGWYNLLDWEDVLMGLLVKDKINSPMEAPGFKAAWRACTNQTAIRHLDLDAPMLFRGLHEQQISGLWDHKTVQCSTGQFQAGDYGGWKAWRNAAAPPNQRV